MTEFLVVPDRDDLDGFRLRSVVGWALDAYARCYNGGRAADWPEHARVVDAVAGALVGKVAAQQAGRDLRATLAGIPYIAIGNTEPIPEHLPAALYRAIAESRRAAGYDEYGRAIGAPRGG